MDRANQDVVGDNCIWNNTRELSLCERKKFKKWVEHYSKLLNVEFKVLSDSFVDVPPVAGPSPRITPKMI